MKIGYDGKRAVSNMTGLGNYSRLVVEEVAARYPEDELLLYTPELKQNPRLAKIEGLPNVEFRLPPPQGFGGGMWRTFGVTNNLCADGVELYHGLSNELPLNIRSAGIPSVVTMHDVIYRRLPECYTAFDRRMYDFKYGRSCRNADHIIAVSERTKQDVVELYGVSPDKVTVIYQGCDPQFRRQWGEDELGALRERLNLPKRFMLQVGTIERRKNLELSVRALAGVAPDIELVVVGRDHHGYKKYVDRLAAESSVAGRIHYYESLDFQDLPGLNQAAEIVLYPSRYEGFGIPVLEGLESCRPVIAATGSCLEEAGGPDTLYVSPDSVKDMIQAIYAVLSDPSGARAMAAAGKEYAARFHSEGMAPQIHAVYETLLQHTC